MWYIATIALELLCSKVFYIIYMNYATANVPERDGCEALYTFAKQALCQLRLELV